MTEERDESTNAVATVGFHLHPQQEVRGAVITHCSLRNKQGTVVACLSVAFHQVSEGIIGGSVLH